MSHIKYQYPLKVKIDGRGLAVHVCSKKTTDSYETSKITLLFLILYPTRLEAGTVSVRLSYENHSKGAAYKAGGSDLLQRTEALKKETKASYRRIDNLVDSDEPNAGLFMKQAMQKQQDLNQLRGLRKQLKEACKFSKEELESCKVRLKPKEGDNGFQTDSSDEDNMSREDQAFNKGVLKGVGPGIVAALKGSAEGLYHLATSPVATIEGLVEFLENIDEVPGLLAAYLEELDGMDPEQQGEEIAKLIADQVFTFAVPTSKVKVLQPAAKTKLGAAAVKVGAKGINNAKTAAKIGKGGFKTLSDLGLKDGIKISSSRVLELGEEFLGKGYKELVPGSGRYISADGKRAFRMGKSDITGAHAGGKHVNFETFIPNPAKPEKMMRLENFHIYLTD